MNHEAVLYKPVPVFREPILKYSECEEYISHKLGYDIRDTLGIFASDDVPDDAEYRDLWNFLTNNRSIVTGEVLIDSELLGAGDDWQDEITQKFIDEFGDNALYLV